MPPFRSWAVEKAGPTSPVDRLPKTVSIFLTPCRPRQLSALEQAIYGRDDRAAILNFFETQNASLHDSITTNLDLSQYCSCSVNTGSPRAVEGSCYETRLRQAQPEQVILAKQTVLRPGPVLALRAPGPTYLLNCFMTCLLNCGSAPEVEQTSSIIRVS